MTKPDIVFIAYRYKAGTAYSILPEDGSADIAFARASSATRINSSGLIESVATDVPRIDYFGGGCPALLLENASTNRVTYSEDISNGDWVKTNLNTTGTPAYVNTWVAPDGTTTGDRIIEDTSTGEHRLARNISTGISVGTDKYAFSFFCKANGRTRFRVFDNNQNTSGVGVFDLATGTKVSGTGGIIDYGGGVYRIWIVPPVDNSSTGVPFIELISTGTTTSYTGDGVSGIDVWGFQFDALREYPTSYVPNLAAGTTTRAIDTPDPIAITATPTGTILIDLTTCLSDAVGDVGVALKDSSGNQIEILFNGASNQNLVSSDGDDEATYKAAGVVVISFDGTDTRVFRNGALVETLDPITDDIESINFVQVGQTRAPKFAFWYTKLSDAECIQRSTL
jgi:hypothetical protein